MSQHRARCRELKAFTCQMLTPQGPRMFYEIVQCGYREHGHIDNAHMSVTQVGIHLHWETE